MKRILIASMIIGIAAISACNNNETSKQNNVSKTNGDTTTSRSDTTPMTEVTHSVNSVDPKTAASIKNVVDDYLQIKNSLINSNGDAAASSGKAMVESISKIEKANFNDEEKKVYGDIESDLKENAEHIGKSAGKIDHQREHFSMMSEDMYELVKTFGGGQVLYHDQCPMANDGKGGMWLSETKEVKNPYFGGKMNDCVKVTEMIK